MPEAQQWRALEARLQQMLVASLLQLVQEQDLGDLSAQLALVLEALEFEWNLSSSFSTAIAGRGPRSGQGRCPPR